MAHTLGHRGALQARASALANAPPRRRESLMERGILGSRLGRVPRLIPSL
jgi:hypothetical protein